MNPTTKLKRVSLALILFTLTQCLTACGVTYRPAPFWGAGGYSNKDLDGNKVNVSFLAAQSGGSHETYTLYRCA